MLTNVLKELKQIIGVELEIKGNALIDEEATRRQLECLCAAYREKYDKTHFLKSLLYEELSTYEINYQAEKLHIESNERRMLFLIEAQHEFDDIFMIVLKNMFPMQTGAYLIPISEYSVVLLHPAVHKKEQIAHSIEDTLNAEALVSVKIASGPEISHLGEMKKSFEEAGLAMKAGKLFCPGKYIFLHDQIGVGQLICDLNLEVCQRFLSEIFRNNVPEYIEPEVISTINRFLENNFNIAETARQMHMHRNTLLYRLEQIESRTGLDLRRFEDAMTFKIALMVMNYINTF